MHRRQCSDLHDRLFRALEAPARSGRGSIVLMANLYPNAGSSVASHEQRSARLLRSPPRHDGVRRTSDVRRQEPRYRARWIPSARARHGGDTVLVSVAQDCAGAWASLRRERRRNRQRAESHLELRPLARHVRQRNPTCSARRSPSRPALHHRRRHAGELRVLGPRGAVLDSAGVHRRG